MIAVFDMEVLDEMELTGGGFVKALAAAMYKADAENLARLRTAFPEYWKTYSDRARNRKEAARRAESRQEVKS